MEGAGHFEPLRHYAEVHLRLEPGERGSGMQFAADCSEDVLDRNYQRLILTHLEEREHKGVLTGSALTDVRITLLSGKAHKSIQKAVISGRRHIVRYVRDFGRRKVFFLNRTTNFVWNCRWKMSEKQ